MAAKRHGVVAAMAAKRHGVVAAMAAKRHGVVAAMAAEHQGVVLRLADGTFELPLELCAVRIADRRDGRRCHLRSMNGYLSFIQTQNRPSPLAAQRCRCH
jgi:hypothetical protein